MSLAGVLILVGILVWLFVSPLIGIILVVIGIIDLIWAGGVVRGGRRRYWY